MDTWAIAPIPTSPTGAGSVAGAWNSLGAVVSAIGEPEFGSRALQCLNHQLPVDFWSVYRVCADRPPEMYVSGSRSTRDVSVDCFRRYRQGLYKVDQTFSSARKFADSGQMAMTLWNEAEIPEPHRDQIYRRHNILERLSVVSSDKDGLLAVNLYRFRDTGSYSNRDVDAASHVADFLLRCVGKHVKVQEQIRNSKSSAASNPRNQLTALCSNLTERELDVCERLLLGWTYDGIASDLGLSVASTKTYRARAFDRLGIHFRNQLFALVK